MLRTLQYVEGDTIGAPGKDEKLCVPESRRTSIPNGEMVELASQVRVQKKDRRRRKKNLRIVIRIGEYQLPRMKVWIGWYQHTYPGGIRNYNARFTQIAN